MPRLSALLTALALSAAWVAAVPAADSFIVELTEALPADQARQRLQTLLDRHQPGHGQPRALGGR